MFVLVIILNITFLFGMAWWRFQHVETRLRKFYWPALLLKLIAGVVLGLVYKVYYSANDTFYFFTEATAAAINAKQSLASYLEFLATPDPNFFFGEVRTAFFVKVVSIPALITMENYWLSSLYLSMFSFFGAWYAFRSIDKNIPEATWAAAVGLLFFPSVVFWSSGIIKESLAMASMFFLTGVFIKIWFRNKVAVVEMLLAIVSIYVIWILKYYYIGLFLPVLLAALLVQRGRRFLKTFWWEFVTVATILLIFISIISQLHPNFHFSKIASVIVQNNQAFMSISEAEDVIYFYRLTENWYSLAVNAPWALSSGLFRPFLWEVNSAPQAVASVENLLILLLVIVSVGYLKLWMASPHRVLVMTIVMYSVLLCVFLALSSPNFGTLSRYRVGFLPFLVILLMSSPTIKRLMTRVGFSW